MIKKLSPPNFFSPWLQWLGILLLSLYLVLGRVTPALALERVPVSRELETQILQVISDNPRVILESLQNYQRQLREEREQSRASLLQSMKVDPRFFIGDSPRLGATAQKLVLFEFSDFQCPYCREAVKTLKEFIGSHHQEVTLVYKHFPLVQIHNQALNAAKAAWAAHQQGKFWSYHDRLFANQDQLGEELYLDFAKELNLDLERFNRDRERAQGALDRDIELAQQLGVDGTPFFVLNGEVLTGAVPLADFEAVLERQQ